MVMTKGEKQDFGLTMASVGTGLTSSLLDAYGQYEQGQMSAASLKAQRSINQSNEKMNQAKFDWELERAEEMKRREVGRTRAIMGKSGLSFDGSLIEVYQDNLYQLNLDIEALEIDKLASLYAAQTRDDYARIEAKYAKRQATIMAIGGGIANFASSAVSSYAGVKGG